MQETNRQTGSTLCNVTQTGLQNRAKQKGSPQMKSFAQKPTAVTLPLVVLCYADPLFEK